ncbi:MAG: DUF503 domain-containing protein [Polyangiaceae bacterium]
MFVGVARIVLRLPGSRSLKDKRRVVRSYKERLASRFPVSVAEIGELNLHQLATLGVCTVSNDSRHCDEVLASCVKLARQVGDAQLSDVATEVVSFGEGGSGIRGGIEQLAHDSPWGAGVAEDSEAPSGDFSDLPWGRPAKEEDEE